MDALEPADELALDLLAIEPLLLVLVRLGLVIVTLRNDVAELVDPDGLALVCRGVVRVVVVVVRDLPVIRVAKPAEVVVGRVVLEGCRPVRGLCVALYEDDNAQGTYMSAQERCRQVANGQSRADVPLTLRRSSVSASISPMISSCIA